MKRQILIVDDSVVNRQILKKILSDDYVVSEAGNGQEALDFLEETNESVSAVLLDIVMPVMDGFTFLEKYKSARKYYAPVIVISAKEAGEAELDALAYGAADFLSKPYNAKLIKHRLKNLIELQETCSLMHLVERDGLTGAYSKGMFLHLAQEHLRGKESGQWDMICVDIEHFKMINDRFGFNEGDRVLVELASILIDKIGNDGMCGRFGGDVFAVLCPHLEGDVDAWFADIVQKMVQKEPELILNLRFGIYIIEDCALPVNNMCDWAILALETIKGKYNTYYTYYDKKIRDRMVREQTLTAAMKTSLGRGEFQVYFQPKYDLMSDEIAGAEALTRWFHPEMGFISPGEFIPLFEKNGFITEMDIFVWDRVCAHIRDWIDRGLQVVPISANVSRADIYNPHLPEVIMEIVERYGLTPQHLHLEITESAYTENPEQLITTVNQLKNMGFKIEMDDFGKGYSSLNMLSELPIDILKLDMQFIQNKSTRKSKSILGFTIGFAKWSGLSVVAEGVETEEQVNLLRNMDCDFVQGYYFAKPLPVKEFEEKLYMRTAQKTPTAAAETAGYPPIQFYGIDQRNELLIVDDIATNRELLADCFTAQFKIAQACDGREALSYCIAHADTLAVVLLDLLMPEMDGFQVLSALKSNPDTRDIPVIITSTADEDNEERSIAMGAADFISKPYRPYLIQNKVANIISLAQLKKKVAGLR